MHTPPLDLFRGLPLRLADANPVLPADNMSVWRHMSDALHNSVFRVLSLLIAVLPGIVAFFVAVLIFTALGMGISALARRALVWVRFDERLSRNRSEWMPSSSPTE